MKKRTETQSGTKQPTYFEGLVKPINWLQALLPVGVAYAAYGRLKEEGKTPLTYAGDQFTMLCAIAAETITLLPVILLKDVQTILMMTALRTAIISFIKASDI